MLLRLCQTKTLLLTLLFSGCTFMHKEKVADSELLGLVAPKWFTVNPEHALYAPGGDPSAHLYFDAPPELSSQNNTVNIIIATPSGSPHAFALDVVSGQRYFTHSFCPQPDVWKKTPGTFDRPDFSVGFIPGYLDQSGEPQKVILLGGRPLTQQQLNQNYHPARLVAAYIEQECPGANCRGTNAWVSRLVFIAVDPLLKKDEDVVSPEDLGRKYEWEQLRTMLENMDGRIGNSENSPLKKIGNIITIQEGLEYFKRNSIKFSALDLGKVTSGCHRLYEKLWQDVGVVRPEDRPATTLEELQSKARVIEDLRRKRLPTSFHERLVRFTSEYVDEINTCGKFIYRGNINLNPEKFWFLSFLGIYYRLHGEGYFFNCNQKTWQTNLVTRDGKSDFDLKTDLQRCDGAAVDQAMALLPSFLNGLKLTHSYYRFVDYDTHAMGSHMKLYSWVKARSRSFECARDPNEEIRRVLKVFPEEARWTPRTVKDGDAQNKVIF